jgi:putative transposase
MRGYILARDECVVTKSGKKMYGLDRFFSSLCGKPVPGLAFFALSLASVKERHDFPVRMEEVIRSEAERAASQAKREASKSKEPAQTRKPGRRKGSRNKNRVDVTLTPDLLHLRNWRRY